MDAIRREDAWINVLIIGSAIAMLLALILMDDPIPADDMVAPLGDHSTPILSR